MCARARPSGMCFFLGQMGPVIRFDMILLSSTLLFNFLFSFNLLSTGHDAINHGSITFFYVAAFWNYGQYMMVDCAVSRPFSLGTRNKEPPLLLLLLLLL